MSLNLKVLVVGPSLAAALSARILADLGMEVVRVFCECPVPRFVDGYFGAHSGVGFGEWGQLDPSEFDAVIKAGHEGVETCPSPRFERRSEQVVCTFDGYPSDHPRHVQPWWESTLSADVGFYRPDGDGLHRWNPIPLASIYGAVNVCLAVVMALVGRERHGRGDEISTSLFETAFTVMGPSSFLGYQPMSVDVWGAGMYETADRKLIQINTLSRHFTPRLKAALDHPDWWIEDFSDRDLIARDPQLRSAFIGLLRQSIGQRSAEEWIEAFNLHRLPAIRIQHFADWVDGPSALASGALRVPDAAVPELHPGLFVELESRPGRWQPFSTINPDAPPLLGVKVVDVSTVVAGPMAGRLLAEFGAQVVKVNDPSDPPTGISTNDDVNRLKEVEVVDLKDPAGMAEFRSTLSDVDVLLHNFAPGAELGLGVDEESVRSIAPQVVYATLAAYGHRGPWSQWRGYESQAQAAVGIMLDFGISKPIKQPLLVNDYGTGLLTALGIGAGLLRRCRSGEGSIVRTALAHTASLLQWCARRPTARDESRARFGPSSSQRLYPTQDGWVMVHTTSDAALSACLGLDPDSGEEDFELEIGLKSTVETLQLGDAEEVTIVESRDPQNLMNDRYLTQRGLLVPMSSPAGDYVACGDPLRATHLQRLTPDKFNPTPGVLAGTQPLEKS